MSTGKTSCYPTISPYERVKKPLINSICSLQKIWKLHISPACVVIMGFRTDIALVLSGTVDQGNPATAPPVWMFLLTL